MSLLQPLIKYLNLEQGIKVSRTRYQGTDKLSAVVFLAFRNACVPVVSLRTLTAMRRLPPSWCFRNAGGSNCKLKTENDVTNLRYLQA